MAKATVVSVNLLTAADFKVHSNSTDTKIRNIHFGFSEIQYRFCCTRCQVNPEGIGHMVKEGPKSSSGQVYLKVSSVAAWE